MKAAAIAEAVNQLNHPNTAGLGDLRRTLKQRQQRFATVLEPNIKRWQCQNELLTTGKAARCKGMIRGMPYGYFTWHIITLFTVKNNSILSMRDLLDLHKKHFN